MAAPLGNGGKATKLPNFYQCTMAAPIGNRDISVESYEFHPFLTVRYMAAPLGNVEISLESY
jgi:hypothetical protein